MTSEATTSRNAPLLILVALIVPLAGSSLAQAQDGNYDVTFDVSEWAELNMEMEDGATIEWDVRSTEGGEFYLDLHSHDGTREVYHERFQTTTGESGTFTAPSDGVYSIYVQNLDASDIRIRLQVIGDFEVESEVRIDPVETNGSPAPGFLLVGLAGVASAAAWYRGHGRRR